MFIMLENQTSNNAGNIVFTVLIVLVILALSGLLVWSIIRERKRVQEEKNAQKINLGLMTRREATQHLNDFIKTYRLSNEATCFIFELSNVTELIDSFGKKNEILLRETMMQNVVNSLPKNTILAEYKPENDSYMIILRGMIPRERILSFADTLADAIEKPIAVPHSDIETSYSCFMGISFYPNQAITSNDLISKADIALYMNHKNQDKRFVTYSPQYSQVEAENVAYYNEIKNAIKNKEFALYYQPIIDHKTNELVGMESLIRWEHPTLGILPPKKFLTILENSGDILWVGSWGISTIASFYHEQRELFKNDFFFSINLSIKQLLNNNIVSEMCETLKKYSVPTTAICIEIEEYALYEKYASIKETLQEFQKKGFKVAVDQFGLDSNNIIKLEKQDFFMLKISSQEYLEEKESFIHQKMAEMLSETCVAKGTKICALKVENRGDMDYLESKGISWVQGYCISEPMDKEHAIAFVKEEKWKGAEE